MQISRHWRMNSQRYRLEGVRYGNGEVSLQARPTQPTIEVRREAQNEQSTNAKVTSPAGR